MTTISLSSSSQPVMAPLRLTVRGRRVFTALIVTPLLVAFIALSVLFAGQAEASQPGGITEFEYLTVGHGDTLWSLAVEVAPDVDPREVISEFKRLNGLTSSSVLPGQQLAIPFTYSSGQ